MTSSWMAHEIASVPELIARQAGLLRQPIDDLTSRLVRHPPQLVVTCGRGSSAHAGLFAKHVIELHLGIPVAPAAPSIASIYHRRLQLRGQLVLIISQSGTSDDLIEFARSARNSGALTVAVTNVEGTPLSSSCDVTLAMGAGPERSVPATKTFLSSLCLVLRLAAAWSQETALGSALCRLPERLTEAANLDWNEAVEVLAGIQRPCNHWPRTDAGNCAGGGAQTEGDLQAQCRGFQRRRVPTRAHIVAFSALPGVRVPAERCSRGGDARVCECAA